MSAKFRFWGAIILLYLLAVGAFSFLQYHNKYGELLAEIDQRLLTAAHATRAIIGTDFHDTATAADSISADQDYQIGINLYEFAQSIGVSYVYSLKQFEDEVLFVVSSATDEELQLNTYEPSYYTQYPEMDQAILEAIKTQTIQKSEYHDRWGSFRSVYVPFKTKSGVPYVMGADMPNEAIDVVVLESMAYTILMACIIGLLLIPLLVLLFKSMNKISDTKYQAMFIDDLTGLPNRNQLLQDLNHTEYAHLLLIDIRKYNDVLNSYGPAIADHVLRQFASRLNHYTHPKLNNLQAYRLGGDVFAMLEDQFMPAEDAIQCSEHLVNHMVEHHYQINAEEAIKLTVTVGGVNQSEDAFVLANMALDEAKNKNLPAYVYDSRSEFLPATYKRNIDIQQRLQLAMDENRLVPFYQPIYDSQQQTIVKYECLARVVDAQGEVDINPDQFIPVARRVGLYPEITKRMVSQSIVANRNNQCIISINLSISDIMNVTIRQFLYQAVKESRMAKRIQFEILETEAIIDHYKVVKFIRKIQGMGAKVGIDDLGRSHSNFDRLLNLPFDFIKIDGSIITSIAYDTKAQAVVKDMVLIAHRHNMKVTAEFCHDASTTDMAVALGVDYLQGFYLGEPAPNL